MGRGRGRGRRSGRRRGMDMDMGWGRGRGRRSGRGRGSFQVRVIKPRLHPSLNPNPCGAAYQGDLVCPGLNVPLQGVVPYNIVPVCVLVLKFES